MARLKQIVKRTDVEVAKARRTCKFSKASIEKGEPCLVVYDGSRDRNCYSSKTAFAMIKMARARLDVLEQKLSEAAPT
jgi:ribosomal protein L24E